MVQPVILTYDTKDTFAFNITSTETIVAGDLCIASGGYVYKMDGATYAATFAGLALDSSASGETTDVAVAWKCVAEIDVGSASYRIPAGLKYTSANTLVDDAGSNTVAWVAENTSSATRLRVLVNALELASFEKNA